MKVNAKDFAKAVKVGGERVNVRLGKTLPVLACVLLKVEAGTATIYSTDLEKVAKARVVAGEGELYICVPAKPLRDWLRVLEPRKDDTLELEKWQRPHVSGQTFFPEFQTLIASCKRDGLTITAHFKGIDPMEFPHVPD